MEKEKEFGQRIKKLRLSKGYSTAQVASKLSTKKSRSLISMWESEARTPTRDDFVALAKIFNVTTDYIMGLSAEDIEQKNRRTYIKRANLFSRIPPKITHKDFEKISKFNEGDIWVPESIVVDKDIFALKITKDNINKIIPVGAIAVFEKTDHLENGEIGTVSYEGNDAKICNYRRQADITILEPISYNPDNKTTVLTKDTDITITGRLIWYCASEDFLNDIY